MRYRESVERQTVEEGKPIKMEGIKEWKVEKILNKIKIREVKNIKKVVAEFEKMSLKKCWV